MKTRTLFVIGIGALAAAALGVVAFRTEPVPVDLAEVRRGPMQVTIDADGKTRIAEIYEVAAPITGTARRAPVRVGDPVVAGETVVAVVEPAASDPLDPRSRAQAEAAVREAEAGLHFAGSKLREAEEELELAQSEFRRAKELVERGVASQTRLETAEQTLGVREAALQAAVSSLEMSKSALDRARAQLIEPGAATAAGDSCCLNLTSPVDGRVLDIDVISARPVTAGTRLLSIGQPDELEIVADLLSADAVRLAEGARARVERWGGSPALEARLVKIEPKAYTKVSALGIEEQRVDTVFELVTPREARTGLGDGFSVYLRITEWEGEDVLQIPLSAVFRQGNDWAVFVQDGDSAALRVIETGRRNAQAAQVLGGLEPGERVITHPSDAIADGTTIVERED